jgi:hypothetical protein
MPNKLVFAGKCAESVRQKKKGTRKKKEVFAL